MNLKEKRLPRLHLVRVLVCPQEFWSLIQALVEGLQHLKRRKLSGSLYW